MQLSKELKINQLQSKKNEEPVQQIKDNDHKDETILLEPKTTLETKTLEDVKTDENSEEAHHEVSNIDDFFDRFEKKFIVIQIEILIKQLLKEVNL